MQTIEPKEQTSDFIGKVKSLLENKIIRTRRELVDKINYHETALSAVMNGKRPVPNRFIWRWQIVSSCLFCTHVGVN